MPTKPVTKKRTTTARKRRATKKPKAPAAAQTEAQARPRANIEEQFLVEDLNRMLELRGLLHRRLPMRVRVFNHSERPMWKKIRAKIMGFENREEECKGLHVRLYSIETRVAYRGMQDETGILPTSYSTTLFQPRAVSMPVACVRFLCGPSKGDAASNLWYTLKILGLAYLRWSPSKKMRGSWIKRNVEESEAA